MFQLLPTWAFWTLYGFVILYGCHLTSLFSSLYLHRSITHKGVIFAPWLAFIMRAWLWMATGMKTKEWVACHRKHHSDPDGDGDPHSPVKEGFWTVMLGGVFLYRKAVADKAMVEKFASDCPDDWWEKHVFARNFPFGIILLIAINVLLFGLPWGLVSWLCLALWMIFIGHVINGMGHHNGYRNTETEDSSTNITSNGILIAGEELHNNHHAYPASPKFSLKEDEIDVGWWYIGLFNKLGWVEKLRLPKPTN